MIRQPIVTVLGLLGMVAFSASGQVGYSMRGDAQPFHNWDSPFNTSGSDASEDDWVIDLGAVEVRPHLGVWFVDDDNVDLDPGGGIDDTYLTIAPGIMLLWGNEGDDYISLNYVYEDVNYTDESRFDFESHLFSAAVRLLTGQYHIHLSDQFSETTDAEPESGQRTSQTLNVETLRLRREISRKTILEGQQRYEIHDFQDDRLFDYDEWWGGLRGYHQTWPKIRTHVSAGTGWIEMQGPDTLGDATYVEGSLGAEGRITAKSSLHAEGGWQRREFDDNEIETIDEWITTVGMSSRLSRRTDWSVDVVRRLTPSSQREGGTRVALGILPTVRHVLWYDRLAASVRGAYEEAEFYGLAGKADREDEYWYVTALLDWQPRQPFTVGLVFTHTEQDSGNDDSDYEQDRIMVRALLNY